MTEREGKTERRLRMELMEIRVEMRVELMEMRILSFSQFVKLQQAEADQREKAEKWEEEKKQFGCKQTFSADDAPLLLLLLSPHLPPPPPHLNEVSQQLVGLHVGLLHLLELVPQAHAVSLRGEQTPG